MCYQNFKLSCWESSHGQVVNILCFPNFWWYTVQSVCILLHFSPLYTSCYIATCNPQRVWCYDSGGESRSEFLIPKAVGSWDFGQNLTSNKYEVVSCLLIFRTLQLTVIGCSMWEMLTLHDWHAEKSTSSNQMNQMAFCRETGVWPMFEIMWGSLVNSSAPGREPSLDWSSTPTVCSSCGRTWVMQWYGYNFGTSVGWSQWLQAFYTPCCLLSWYRFMWFDCRFAWISAR